MEQQFPIVGIILLILFLILAYKGIKQAFQRQPVVAALMLIFLFPVFAIWAFVELFLDKPNRVVRVEVVESDNK
jgi:uncharacterized membrane protein